LFKITSGKLELEETDCRTHKIITKIFQIQKYLAKNKGTRD
jgi:hypothetical protein